MKWASSAASARLGGYLLNPEQRLVRKHTLDDTVFHDKLAAATALKDTGFPAHFLDFETAGLAVPVWAGTRPYQQIPVQFSVHIVCEDMGTDHHEFLGLDGTDPSRALGEALVAACEQTGPVFVYNATFERGVLRSLASRFSDLSNGPAGNPVGRPGKPLGANAGVALGPAKGFHVGPKVDLRVGELAHEVIQEWKGARIAQQATGPHEEQSACMKERTGSLTPPVCRRASICESRG